MDQNENRSRFDVSTFIPLGVGIISLFGICLILIASRLAAPRSVVQVPDTATPFRYLFLGTEPGILSAVPGEDGEIIDPFATPDALRTPQIGFAITAQSGFADPDADPVTRRPTQNPAVIFTRTRTPTPDADAPLSTRPPTRPVVTSTAIELGPLPSTNVGSTPTGAATPSRTPTSASVAPLIVGRYDDTDSRLVYTGNWVINGTLHVSTTIGNSIQFSFVGDELHIFFQAGSGLGTMSVVIDAQEATLNQTTATNNEWVVPISLTYGTHSVTIRHLNGGSINFDQIVVLNLSATPTPTPTATATSTP